jgi:hypothetical protein
MTVATRSAPNVLLQLCSTTAILMTLTGLVFLLGTHVLNTFARGQGLRETDAISVALIFGGIAVALKTIEVGLRAEHGTPVE